MLDRKWLLGAAVAMLLSFGAEAQTTLKVVMHSDVKIIDPIWTTAYIVRNHGYMIYDTLFAVNDKLEVKPQMVETWKVSDDKLIYTFTLRDGLKFHDGATVTSEDCIASIKRWASRDAMGQKLMQFTKVAFSTSSLSRWPITVACVPPLNSARNFNIMTTLSSRAPPAAQPM